MMKRWMMALALLMCLLLLAACQNDTGDYFTIKTSPSATNAQSAGSNTGNSTGLLSGEDPMAEEDDYSQAQEIALPSAAPVITPTPTPALVFRGEYAGATPVPLDPIDKPTPTPVPPLAAFSYKTYEATKLNLSFDGPAGWTVDASDPAYYVITNPNTRVAYQAQLTVHAEKVNKQYSDSELKSVVQGMLDSVKQDPRVKDFSPSRVDPRNFLETSGYYANYTATLADGTTISGRMVAVCVEKVVYTVHLTAPKDYWTEYKDGVYDKLEHTIKITK